MISRRPRPILRLLEMTSPQPPLLDSARFELLRQLGEGGQGIVVEATDRQLGCRVAVKVLPRFDPRRSIELKQELAIRARLVSPHLVHVHELLVEEDGTAYLIMERVDGVDIVSHLRAAPAEAQIVATQLLRGLAALHHAGVVHRDIKPTNVLVEPGPRVVILDFGLAVLERAPSSDEVAGTLAYMAPEQLVGQRAVAASDVYSAGLCLYEAIAGEPPFSGRSGSSVFTRTLRDAPSLARATRGADVALSTVVDDLLARHVADRPTAAGALARLEGVESRDHGSRFVGRAIPLAELEAAWKGAGPRPQIVRIIAPSGMGKTRLAQEFVRRSLPVETLLFAGRCQPTTSRPYEALDECADAIAIWAAQQKPETRRRLLPVDGRAELLAAFPSLRAIDEPTDRVADPEGEVATRLDRLSGAFVALVDRLRAAGPLVLWLDDVQWADRDSIPLLAAVMRDAAQHPNPLLVLLTQRPLESHDHGGAQLAAVLPVGRTTDIDLEPLTSDALREWVELAAPEMEVRGRERLVDTSGGNPLVASELLRASGLDTPSRSAQDLVARRIAALDPRARGLLEALAVSPAPLRRSVLLGLASDADVAWRMLFVLANESLAKAARVEGELAAEPFHDSVRDAVLRGLAPEQRRIVHGRLLARMRELGEPSVLAVFPHLKALDRAREARAAALAGARALQSQLAFDRAAEMYREALALADDDSGQLHGDLADALADAGRGEEAAAAYLDAAARVDEQVAVRLRVKAAEQLLHAGHLDRGRTILTDAVRSVGVRVPSTVTGVTVEMIRQRLRLAFRKRQLFAATPRLGDPIESSPELEMLWRGARSLSLIEPVLSNALATRLLIESLDHPDPVRQAESLGMEAGVRSSLGGPEAAAESRHLLERAAAVLGASDDLEHRGSLRICEATVAYFEFRIRDVRQLSEEALDAFGRVPGKSWLMAHAFSWYLTALAYLGEYALLEQERARAIRWAERRDDQFLAKGLRLGMPVLADLHAGRAEACLHGVETALEQWPAQPFHLFHYLQVVGGAMAELSLGVPERAWARVAGRWGALQRAGYLRLPFTRAELTFLRARAALSQPARPGGSWIVREAEKALRDLRRSKMPSAEPFARVVEAGLAWRRSGRSAAEPELRRAEEAFAAHDLLGYAAAARDLSRGACSDLSSALLFRPPQ
ncbi:MAG: protein kinase [Myxococcales bacterium]|nr:protein kinase [Myxococcales bacterium]